MEYDFSKIIKVKMEKVNVISDLSNLYNMTLYKMHKNEQ